MAEFSQPNQQDIESPQLGLESRTESGFKKIFNWLLERVAQRKTLEQTSPNGGAQETIPTRQSFERQIIDIINQLRQTAQPGNLMPESYRVDRKTSFQVYVAIRAWHDGRYSIDGPIISPPNTTEIIRFMKQIEPALASLDYDSWAIAQTYRLNAEDQLAYDRSLFKIREPMPRPLPSLNLRGKAYSH